MNPDNGKNLGSTGIVLVNTPVLAAQAWEGD